ncbi:MAG TPA: DUF362 domain-containing protein [Candidatus Wallbacteria bacterium]|nr:DUF362 domain-containing protein [Candidatus Wallbacteria bacterium]
MKKVYFKSVPKNAAADEIARINLELILKTDVLSRVKIGNFVAIKMHFGDNGNIGHIKPETVKILADEIKRLNGRPFLVETSTLYVGARANAVDHLNIAYKHGFTYERTGVPIVMADGLLGHSHVPVSINGSHYKEVYVATDVPHYDFIISLSHVTGHVISGMGASLKNIGMGLAARGGKLAQHSNVNPSVVAKKCVKCGRCQTFCPAGAISRGEDAYVIDKIKCIGCGECIAICKNEAIKFSWKQSSKIVQEKMAEHALGILKGKEGHCVFANHMIHVTNDCDCMAKDDPAAFDDIGIAVSEDPVAVDRMTLDICLEKHGFKFENDPTEPLNPYMQLEHGEKIKLGSMKYELAKVD